MVVGCWSADIVLCTTASFFGTSLTVAAVEFQGCDAEFVFEFTQTACLTLCCVATKGALEASVGEWIVWIE